MAETEPHEDESTTSPQGKALEWIIAGISAVLLVALIVYIAFIAFTAQGGTPRLVLEVDSIDANRPGYVVVNLKNEGEASAGDVHIEGRLSNGEVGEVVLDYSPAKSSLQATLVFSRPVSEGEITLHVKGFSEP